jgi:ribosomal protein S12 methylthiotransferase
MTRVGLIGLGCAKNLVDGEVMLGHLAASGFELVTDPSQADVLIVNTCSFIGPAREESIRAILEAAEHKKTGRLKRLVVSGCLVQRYARELQESLPEVDAFVDLDGLSGIAAAVRGPVPAPAAAAAEPGSWSGSTYLYDHRTPRRRATPPWTAYVKIAEGCDHTCSFCAIPGFRGAFRSRELASVVREAEALAAEGVREINLVAQDSSHYGRDLGVPHGLAALLVALDRVEGLRWIRAHYLYPNTVTDRVIEALARGQRVLDYVDMPLQHAHPAMLKRMRRGGSGAEFLALLDRFRAAMPEVTLRSTFIVGFPGETEAEFSSLLEFVCEARFDHLGGFMYSHEEGTTAVELDDDVPEPLKRERLERLMAGQQAIAFERNRRRIGARVEVLVEGVHPETERLLVGRARAQAPEVDGQVLINDGDARPGEFVEVELTDMAGYDWVGGIVARV